MDESTEGLDARSGWFPDPLDRFPTRFLFEGEWTPFVKRRWRVRNDALWDEAEEHSPLPPDDWYPDPANRFKRRYWEDAAWTDKVTNLRGDESVDFLTTEPGRYLSTTNRLWGSNSWKLWLFVGAVALSTNVAFIVSQILDYINFGDIGVSEIAEVVCSSPLFTLGAAIALWAAHQANRRSESVTWWLRSVLVLSALSAACAVYILINQFVVEGGTDRIGFGTDLKAEIDPHVSVTVRLVAYLVLAALSAVISGYSLVERSSILPPVMPPEPED